MQSLPTTTIISLALQVVTLSDEYEPGCGVASVIEIGSGIGRRVVGAAMVSVAFDAAPVAIVAHGAAVDATSAKLPDQVAVQPAAASSGGPSDAGELPPH